MSSKLWGGRFTGKTDPLMEKFNASINFDKRLWAVDLRGSQAYAWALARSGIITTGEAEQLVTGLAQVAGEWPGPVVPPAAGVLRAPAPRTARAPGWPRRHGRGGRHPPCRSL